jgi:aspartyl-tRNA synthetase
MFNRIYVKDAQKHMGEQVDLAGWINRVRELSNIKFIVIRDITGEIQVVIKPNSDFFELELGKEDVISITGLVIDSKLAHSGIEIVPEKIKIISKSKQPLPFDLHEQVKAELETRLNYRFLDFRTPTTSAIFKIQNKLITSFRFYLIKNGYMEFQPPCIIGSASEGGAELFSIPYFDKTAYLAQSPQLYKQMAAISFEKVYTITPVWRAEKFNTPTHLNEVRQMDIEKAFADDNDVMNLLEKTVTHMLDDVKNNCITELKLLNQEIKSPRTPFLRITYTEAVELLQEKGEKISWGDDFTKSQERILTDVLGENVFFIKDWCSAQKAFYALPHKNNPELVHAFDLLYNGIEISSGTQRIHIPDLLQQQIIKKELDPQNFQHYITAFSYGAPPHAGWSIGLERLTMALTGRNNIRECAMFPRDRDRLMP